MIANREQVEQSLRRVFVTAIAGVDHIGRNSFGQKTRSTRRSVAHHHHIDAHGFQVARGIDECFTFLHRRSARRDVHRVCRQTLLRELERNSRSRRWLKEQIDDGFAAEDRDFLDRALADFLERLGSVEDHLDAAGLERLEANQVLAEPGLPAHASGALRVMSSAPSRPSISGTNTSTCWFGAAEIFLPTISGWMGSSRPPRSTSTHRKMRAGLPKSASSSSAARTVRPV